MKQNYLLVDYENLSTIDLSILQADMKVVLFLGETSKIKADYLNKIIKKGNRIELIKISGSGHNAVDFHIAWFIGACSEREPGASFSILSRDTGYDPLIKFLSSMGIQCSRVDGTGAAPESVTLPKDSKETEVDKKVESIKKQLIKSGKDKRPKTAKRFEAFVKSHGKYDEKTVTAIINRMFAGNLIAIQGDNIQYHF